MWGRIEDEYFFVLFSFVAMGAVAIFEWEMLFPDRLDFLILTPLPLPSLQMLVAKAVALAGFLVLFLVGANLFGMLVLPGVTAHSHRQALATFRGTGVDWTYLSPGSTLQAFWHQAVAHAAAVLLAGLFATLCIIALGGVLLCVLDAARFRIVSPLVQILAMMALVLLLVQYAKYGDDMQALLTGPLGKARWMPPVWFLGIYELMLRGSHAPPFAHRMVRYAVRGTASAAGVALLTYPLAWARMRRMAMEGVVRPRRRPTRWLARLQHAVIRRPGERAAFHFIGQTMARNNRYEVYLAMYTGTGLALALACAVGFRVDAGSFHPMLSTKGLHATMPLLVFWVVVGLRIAFAFPLNLAASWIFRVTGVSLRECAAGARKWALFAALCTEAVVLAILRVAGWSARPMMVQAVCGLCLCVLLTDGLFFSQQTVPFSQPRMPGRVSFPLVLTLWAMLPVFLYGVVDAELHFEQRPLKLVLLMLATAAAHLGCNLLHTGPEEVPEQMEGYEGEFQLLGLS